MLQRSANLLKAVAESHEVTLLAFNQKDILRIYDADLNVSLPAAVAAMEEICQKVKVVDIDCDTRRAGKLRLALSSLFSRLPYSIRWLISDAYQQALNEELAADDYDVIWFDTISLAQYKSDSKMAKAFTILNHHNIESDMMFRRSAKESNFFKKTYFYLEAYKLRSYERKEAGGFDINVTCSELDAKRIGCISQGVKTHVVPNGVDTGFFSSSNEVVPDPYFLIFIGGMSWYPNREAMLFFARQVWPLLKVRVPNINMHAVGEAPPKELIDLSKKDNNYHVYGFVDDIKCIFNKAGIYICPISDGGGTKLKILDALAMGRPIVAHPVACEGIDVIDGENVMFAETPEEYVSKIIELIEKPSLRTEMSEKNRKLILDKYSYSVIGDGLLRLLERKV